MKNPRKGFAADALLRVYKHKRETLEGSFSLANTELRVGRISDTRGRQYKGISLYGGLHGYLIGADRAIVLDEAAVEGLLEFLLRLQRKDLPASFSVRMNRFETFSWDVGKFLPNWHDGGGLSGNISIRSLLGASLVGATITMEATQRLEACIRDFYGMES